MILLLGCIGWGLITFGAITHLMDHERLVELLGMHMAKPRLAANALTAVELAVAIGIPVAATGAPALLNWFALGAGALGVVFIVWIARLLMTSSSLPCACSFSSAPTTPWSLGRAVLVLATAFLFLVDEQAVSADAASTAATFLVALGIAGAVYAIPEAVAWPASAGASLARIEAHRPGERRSP